MGWAPVTIVFLYHVCGACGLETWVLPLGKASYPPCASFFFPSVQWCDNTSPLFPIVLWSCSEIWHNKPSRSRRWCALVDSSRACSLSSPIWYVLPLETSEMGRSEELMVQSISTPLCPRCHRLLLPGDSEAVLLCNGNPWLRGESPC